MLKKAPIVFFSILFVVFFILFHLAFYNESALDTFASYVTTPIIKISNAIATPIRYFAKNGSYNTEIVAICEKLQDENHALLLENVKLKALMTYADKSKELLEFQDKYKLEGAILSRVLIKTLTNQEHSFVVNRGSRDGVKLDMIAIYKFQLLGRVSQVFPCYSKITLITDKLSKVSAYTNTNNSHGILEGMNTVNLCKLLYISHLKPVQNDDLVFSSGEGLIYPEGFCLGKITSIRTENLCHQIDVTPLMDFNIIEMCHLTSQAKMNLF
jgi:rod shape-determining protein MreC